MNAFIVEDNRGIREVLIGVLEQRGHTVVAFEDAESAIPVLRTQSFQLGVMDWGLPGLDGLELCRLYRDEFPHAPTSIIILTGRAEPDDLDEVVAAGANDYITKPFKLDALETRIAFAERMAVVKAREAEARDVTPRSSCVFKDLIESIPIITYIEKGDQTREIKYISPQIVDLMGWTPEEVISTPGFWLDILHPDDVQVAVQQDLAAEAEATRFSHDYRQRCRNGEYRWFRDDAEPIFDEFGKTICWHGAILDIHKQKEFELALREEELRHRDLSIAAQRQANELRLLDRVRSTIAHELELQNVFRTVVEATADILGYPYTSLYVRDGDELVMQHQVGYSDLTRIYYKMARGQGVIGNVGFSGEARLVRDIMNDQDFLEAESDVAYEICIPLFDERTVVGAINVETTALQPLTEDDLRLLSGVGELVNSAISRARLFNDAKESELQLRSVLDDVREVVFKADTAGRWTFLNQAWEEISGFSVRESLGRSAMDFTVPENETRIREVLEDVCSGRVSEVRGTFEIVTRTGVHRWLEAHASRVGVEPNVSISGTLTDITDRKHAEEALLESQERYRHLALHDPLTTLPNRLLFMERLEQSLATAAREETTLSVLYLDLDGFKLVNDTLGHEAGDALLVQVADRLNRSRRAGDTVARLGGDEFALLVEDDDELFTSRAVSERIINSFRTPFTYLNQEVSLATSIGIASHTGRYGSPGHLLRNADTALYVAKARGRGLYVEYQPRMSTAVAARYQREAQLRQAIAADEFALLYQPVFDFDTNKIIAIDSVLSWRNEDQSLLSPAEVFALAESTGQSIHLGDLTLQLACQDLARWKRLCGDAIPAVSMKLLPKQLRDATLAARTSATLLEHGIAATNIDFVVEDASVTQEESNALSTLLELRRSGPGLVLDRVGSGAGALAALRDLPLTAVQIDRTLVRDLSKDRACKEIVRAITALARTLGLLVTATGIENLDQLAHARSVGIDRGTGPHFGGAITADAVASLLLNGRSAVIENSLLQR